MRIVGQPALRTSDSRRSPAAHLSVSLVYLRDILLYLQRNVICYYRLAPTLLPATPAVSQQLVACRGQLAAVAEQIAAQGVRLTLHLGFEVALGSSDPRQSARSRQAIETQAALLDCLGVPADGSLIVHIGGATRTAAQRQQALASFAHAYRQLAPAARTRLAVEHDSAGFSLGDLLHLHQVCGVPVVFDYLHWHLHNPEHLPLELALGLALATWPAGVRPEVHLSTARSEAHLLPASDQQGKRVLPPRPGQHADFIALPDLIRLLRAASGLPAFDIMLEAKAGDLAVLRARSDLARTAPDLAARVA